MTHTVFARAVALAYALHASCAWPQSAWREVAVPSVPAETYVAMLSSHWYRPRAIEFAQRADALAASVARHCAGASITDARRAWREALFAWDRLSSVMVGPLTERRSARRIDFQPVRPNLVDKAIAAVAAGELDTSLVGSAARGFAALEWLLWPQQGSAGGSTDPNACRLASVLAADVAKEATELSTAFGMRATEALDEAAIGAPVAELVNQWIGGIESLRMQCIERPLREARAKGLDHPLLPRAASAASADERQAKWQALRALAISDLPTAPPLGSALVPLETVLRGKGLNPLADRLVDTAHALDAALGAAGDNQVSALEHAGRAAEAMRRLVESEVAQAFNISVGFSDADGD